VEKLLSKLNPDTCEAAVFPAFFLLCKPFPAHDVPTTCYLKTVPRVMLKRSYETCRRVDVALYLRHILNFFTTLCLKNLCSFMQLL